MAYGISRNADSAYQLPPNPLMSGDIFPDDSADDGGGGSKKGKKDKKDKCFVVFALFAFFASARLSSLRGLSFRCIPTSAQSERYVTVEGGNYVQFDESKLVGDCAARTGRCAVRNQRVYVAWHHVVGAGGALRRIRAGGRNLRGDRVLQARRRGRALVGAAV